MQPYGFLLIGLGVVIALGLVVRRWLPGTSLEVPKRVVVGVITGLVAVAAVAAGMYVLDVGQWDKAPEVELDVSVEEWNRERLARAEGFKQMSKAMSKKSAFAVSAVSTLVTLIQKLEMLDGQGSLALEPQQARTILSEIEGLEAQAQLSDDDARGKAERILSTLNDGQRQAVQSAELPAQAGQSEGSSGAAAPGSSANPFQTEPVAAQLKDLRTRLTDRAGSDGR